MREACLGRWGLYLRLLGTILQGLMHVGWRLGEMYAFIDLLWTDFWK